jgi:predicted  nucleic acid-binding Zn-ribbon protein
MELKVEDLTQRMRARAHEHASTNNLATAADEADALSARVRAYVTAAKRAQDQLPPVTTYRSGLAAKIELWVKRRLKRTTNWFTFEQVNFNAAIAGALETLLPTIARIENGLGELGEAPAGADAQDRFAELQKEVVELSRTVQALLERLQDLQVEQREYAEEQHVCFKQLSSQLNEFSIVADRTKRNFQLQLDEMNLRINEMRRHESKDA